MAGSYEITDLIRHRVAKGLFLSILLILYAGTIDSVSAQISFSEKPADEPGFGFVKVIGQDEGGYFVLLSNLSHNLEADRVGFKNRKYKIAYYDTLLRK